MTKHTKNEVQYSRGMIGSHCGKVFPNDYDHCKHFRGAATGTEDGVCTQVEGGISRVYWCKLFKKVTL